MEEALSPGPASGPLRPHPLNPRYFADATGRAVCLAGCHTWNCFQDFGAPFDYAGYLSFMKQRGYNFFRMWAWEHSRGALWSDAIPDCPIGPLPYARTGPGAARDGLPRFDLTRFHQEYFDRLRLRVAAAGEAGVYVAVMLFQGFSVEHYGDRNPFPFHPMHRDNNINEVDGDPGRAGDGRRCHTLDLPRVTAIQEAYVRKVIETVGDLPNVLYEVSNESGAHSTEWQYHIIRRVKEMEASRAQQHPVGMTYQWEGGTNEALFRSPADWISPNPEGGYGGAHPDPSGAYAGKVIVPDTDHLWGIGGHRSWVWRSFMRGLNPIFMDPYDGALIRGDGKGQWQAVNQEEVRAALSHTLSFARRLDMAALRPAGELSSTRFCLAAPGETYFAYQPASGAIRLMALPGEYSVEWFNPVTGVSVPQDPAIATQEKETFPSPFEGEAALLLRRRR